MISMFTMLGLRARVLGSRSHLILRSMSSSSSSSSSWWWWRRSGSSGWRYKQLLKDYWYVLVPVHVSTSLLWLSSFFLLCKSGVDVAKVCERLGVSSEYVAKVQDSNLGYLALAYLCYKGVTPIRYALTIAATTLTIRKLGTQGALKTSADLVKAIRKQKKTHNH